jgi:hypothetical protein
MLQPLSETVAVVSKAALLPCFAIVPENVQLPTAAAVLDQRHGAAVGVGDRPRIKSLDASGMSQYYIDRSIQQIGSRSAASQHSNSIDPTKTVGHLSKGDNKGDATWVYIFLLPLHQEQPC